MTATEPLIHWPEPLFEFAGFVASFLATGAIGFRFGVLGRMRGPAPSDLEDARVRADASRRAAWLGTIGTVLAAALLVQQLPESAAEKHLTVLGFVMSNRMIEVEIAGRILALLGFALASSRRAGGWRLAALGVLGGSLRAAFSGKWERLVNPLHVLAGGLWIGTLLVMVAAGLTTVLRSRLDSERRGTIAAQMVNAFSPLALASAGMLALFGVITAWRHLHHLQALWSTPYGITLSVKLCMVAGVAALGAWNWRRQRPQLGTELGARSLRRSATAELIAATIVLAITAILVSLPSPDNS